MSGWDPSDNSVSVSPLLSSEVWLLFISSLPGLSGLAKRT